MDIAMVLCDERWLDPDQDMTNGYDDITTPGDLLRLESVARSPPSPTSWLASVAHLMLAVLALLLDSPVSSCPSALACCFGARTWNGPSAAPPARCAAIEGILQDAVHAVQVLAAQLNVRMRLERASRGFVSIVAEKMAYGSQTRFEDFTQLPVGISVNFTSFSSKMLAFLAHYPKLLVPYFSIGDTADVEVCRRSPLLQTFADPHLEGKVIEAPAVVVCTRAGCSFELLVPHSS